jgi:hypothetical protein
MSLLLGVRESLGHALGRASAPVTANVSAFRRARMFHPEGIVCTGRVLPVPGSRFAELGPRLRGPVLARFSAALWKGRPRWFDVLGIALRFDREQDLLFATIRSPFTMPFAPLPTETDDFFANRYWTVSPFAVAGLGRLKFRLSPVRTRRPRAATRAGRLRAAVEEGSASWLLEARRVFRRRYHPVARIEIDRVAPEVDQEALRFDPFRAGRGIVPSGLVHAIRPAAYAASQRARPSHERLRQ